MKVIIIGATGATGKELVEKLLADKNFSEVVVLVRRHFFPPQPKLKEIVVDFENMEGYFEFIEGDVAVSCLGTTRKDAGNKANQWHIDHDIPLKFAQIAYRNEVKNFVLLSSMNADSSSSIFYSRMKGVLEDDIKKIPFKSVMIFRPGLLIRPGSDRFAEKVAVRFFSFINQLGIGKGSAPLHVKDLAEAMQQAILQNLKGIQLIPLNKIRELIR